MNYLIHLLIYFEIYLILAWSLNIIVGYCGLLSLAHATYYALGAYTYAILTIGFGLDFITALSGAIAVSIIGSLLLSAQALRLRGDYFVLGALALQVLFYNTVSNWYSANATVPSLLNLTNGPFGISGISKPRFFSHVISDSLSFLLLCTSVTAVVAGLVWRFTSGDWGRLLIAIRDNELAARGLGKNVRLARSQAIAISSALAAVAGCLYASYANFVDPGTASLDESILILSMVLLGGSGNFRGSFVGAAVLVALPELLRLWNLPDSVAANVRMALYGMILVLIVHFRPQGIAGTYRIQ